MAMSASFRAALKSPPCMTIWSSPEAKALNTGSWRYWTRQRHSVPPFSWHTAVAAGRKRASIRWSAASARARSGRPRVGAGVLAISCEAAAISWPETATSSRPQADKNNRAESPRANLIFIGEMWGGEGHLERVTQRPKRLRSSGRTAPARAG